MALAYQSRRKANCAGTSTQTEEIARCPMGAHDRAVAALGHVGITDVICQMAFYTSVSMTLAFYDVPAGAEGLAR